MSLEMVIGTATVTGKDGDLATLFAAHPVSARHPDGVHTTLSWSKLVPDNRRAGRHTRYQPTGGALNAWITSRTVSGSTATSRAIARTGVPDEDARMISSRRYRMASARSSRSAH